MNADKEKTKKKNDEKNVQTSILSTNKLFDLLDVEFYFGDTKNGDWELIPNTPILKQEVGEGTNLRQILQPNDKKTYI